jgi:thymidylate synthase
VFGRQLRFDLRQGFPLVTTKQVHTRSIILELLWFLQGRTDNEWLRSRGCTIWDEWADERGELGPVYGKQWRSWACPDGSTIDQISQVVELIRTKPDSRRLLVTVENVRAGKMALAACHAFFQFYVAEGRLSCQMYQRSADLFLGVPFNIASYALLTHMIATECGLEVGDFVHVFGDCHLYLNHLTDDIVFEQLRRQPRPLPKLVLKRKPASLFDYELEDFAFEGYDPHPRIVAPVAV